MAFSALGGVLQAKRHGILAEVSTSVLNESDCVGIYFSAHWCPPCRGFTPQLAQIYNSIKAAGGKFEIVFASSDQDEAGFEDYYSTMPWLALPYSQRDIKAALSAQYSVNGIPSLILLDRNGAVITADGRSTVLGDPQGDSWLPRSSSNLSRQASLDNDIERIGHGLQMDGPWVCHWEDGNTAPMNISGGAWSLFGGQYQLNPGSPPSFNWGGQHSNILQSAVSVSDTEVIWTTTHPQYSKITWRRPSTWQPPRAPAAPPPTKEAAANASSWV